MLVTAAEWGYAPEIKTDGNRLPTISFSFRPRRTSRKYYSSGIAVQQRFLRYCKHNILPLLNVSPILAVPQGTTSTSFCVWTLQIWSEIVGSLLSSHKTVITRYACEDYICNNVCEASRMHWNKNFDFDDAYEVSHHSLQFFFCFFSKKAIWKTIYAT